MSRMKSLVLFVGSWVAMSACPAPGRAESPPLQCDGSWWIASGPLFGEHHDVPARPHVMLPLTWVRRHGGDRVAESELPAGALEAPILTVTVRGPDGEPVGGTVDLRPSDALPVITSPPLLPRWKPSEPLTPGATYTVHAAVPALPSEESALCGFEPIDMSLSLTVATQPLGAPAITVDAGRTVDRPLPGLTVGPCGSAVDEALCEGYPGLCCTDFVTSRTLTATWSLEGELSRSPDHLVATMSSTRPDRDLPAPSGIVTYPFDRGPTFERSMSWFLRDGETPALEDMCMTTAVTDLMRESTVVATVCADPERHVPAELGAPRICEPTFCALAAREQEPGPDRTTEGAVDVGPGEPNGGSGCSSGGLPISPLLWWGVMLLALSVRRRPAGCA